MRGSESGEGLSGTILRLRLAYPEIYDRRITDFTPGATVLPELDGGAIHIPDFDADSFCEDLGRILKKLRADKGQHKHGV